MSRLERGLTFTVAAGAALYVGFAAWSGFRTVGERLSVFSGWTALGALLLASSNYLFRFPKWHYLLGRLGIDIPKGRSLGIFLSGFALTLTPGKLGEVLKSYLLRETDGVPMARTAPIVIAERLTDLIACLALTVVGMAAFSSAGGHRVAGLMTACAALVVGLLGAVAIRPIGELGIALVGKLPVVGKLAPKLREFYESTRVLMAPRALLWTSALSTVAWAAECAAFWLVIRGFPGASASIGLAMFIYAGMTIAGALSFLPGGLLVQESGMVALLVATAHGLDEPTALAATIITRLCTLWFAVLVGVVALSIMRRRVDLARFESSPAAAVE